jgi:hypothetical protein
MADTSKCSAYVGKIANAGSQVVQAPMQTTEAKNGKVQTGTDLRTGKK